MIQILPSITVSASHYKMIITQQYILQWHPFLYISAL